MIVGPSALAHLNVFSCHFEARVPVLPPAPECIHEEEPDCFSSVINQVMTTPKRHGQEKYDSQHYWAPGDNHSNTVDDEVAHIELSVRQGDGC